VKLGNLTVRLVTAAVLVPLLILAINWDKPYAVWALVYAGSLFSLGEFFAMALDDKTERLFGVVLGGVLSLALYWRPDLAVAVYPAAFVLPGLFFLFRFQDLSTVMVRLGTTTFGIVYAGLFMNYLALLKRDAGFGWVYMVLMIGWWGDTGGYFAGRFLGKKKLYPAISPSKTWAGAVGGLAGSCLAAVVANLWFFKDLGWVHGIVLTLLGGMVGQCGDLVESMLKRARGVKDSGKLLPGHGGMLDRIDAVLFVAPFTYVYYLLVWR
jgi:phosphatidate cytidylyltransferase